MGVRVFINGFGRIGRTVLRVAGPEIEFVGINDITDAATLAHLLKYDSLHGRFEGEISHDETSITVNGRRIPVTAHKEPAKLWAHLAENPPEIVYECTGRFKKVEEVMGFVHEAKAKKVIVSAPLSGAMFTAVMGVNHEAYDPAQHHVLSNASCTTNCLAPLVYVLDKEFGVVNGLMTTVHSYTNDQRILDAPHSDLRRARAAALNMIPTSTGAAKAVGEVLPHLKGKLHGYAMRVPTGNVSVVDLTANLKREVSKAEVDAVIRQYADGALKGILQFVDEPLVSGDFNGQRYSSMYDSQASMVLGKEKGSLVKLVSWYDNETGYSCRMNDLARYVASRF